MAPYGRKLGEITVVSPPYTQKMLYLVARAVLVFAVLLVGCEGSVKHDEALAERRAKEFADVAFVNKDFQKAYSKLSSAAKAYVTPEIFEKTVAQRHPNGYPTKVIATGFELIPSETKAIYIFLIGENRGSPYYYRLLMQGNADSDYKVSIADIEFSPYPDSPVRKSISTELSPALR